uniref:Uncharacterized protein n=1 Tax=Oryza barthii TaxID=65489 RepID=A0A0D3EU03_9ORYZ
MVSPDVAVPAEPRPGQADYWLRHRKGFAVDVVPHEMKCHAPFPPLKIDLLPILIDRPLKAAAVRGAHVGGSGRQQVWRRQTAPLARG